MRYLCQVIPQTGAKLGCQCYCLFEAQWNNFDVNLLRKIQIMFSCIDCALKSEAFYDDLVWVPFQRLSSLIKRNEDFMSIFCKQQK